MRNLLPFLVLIAVASAFGNIQTQFDGPDEVELRLLEPAVVPDPVDGVSRWWYTPSRKAHIYRHKYPKNIQAQPRQGEDLRLPGDVLPRLYNVRLLPFIEVGNWTTDGYVEIFLDCIISTVNISMNSLDLTIDPASITVTEEQTGNPISVVDFIDEQSTREIITIQVSRPLTAGKQYKITMKFISILNALLAGFYRSSYVENGVTKYLAVTQFEATDARRSFPCFDEPTMKANFTVTVGRKETWTSVSNMPLITTEPIVGMPGFVWDNYQTSVTMSSYLVAFMVSEFIGIPAEPGLSNVEFSIWARPEARNLTDYARNIGPRILEFFESYYNIDYPLPKQDMAAIPDFAAGAMENWGLITYREQYLLIDPSTATARAVQLAAVVSAHELAHQWFGNLVTMDWWNALWLNEGFASYMEYIGTDAVEPDFKMNDQFIIENLQYVFGIDALETSRPINIEVNTPAEINSMFDAISYEKGSCVIRMCADIIGLETFQRGLTRYLNDNAYGNAGQDNLWAALQTQADSENVILPATVKEIMDTWTFKMGFPYVTVIRNYQTGGAVVIQNRFLLRKSNDTTDPTVYQWWVPLTYTSDYTQTQQRDWLSVDEFSKSLPNLGAAANQWVIFNVDQQNYYRVAYDPTNYGLIRDQLIADHQRVSANNRAQLLDDSFNLALTELIPYTDALDLTLYLKYEREYVPWHAVLSELNYVDIMLYNFAEFSNWKTHMTSLVEPYYNFIGFQETQSDPHLTKYCRIDAMNWACRLGVADCVQNSLSTYATLMSQPDNLVQIVSPNEKSTILRTAIEYGGQAEYDFAFNQYKTKSDTSFLVAMCASKQATVLSGLLEMLLDPTSGILSSDVNTVFNNVANNPIGNEIALDFLINRWDDIQNALGSVYFATWYRYVCTRQNTQAGLDKLIQLRDAHSVILGNSNSVKQGIQTVESNIKWVSLNLGEIGTWLAGNQPA
ncbi:aminopeptidase N-like [Daphnia pulicaria]|uniref:aminopeptidase N-like n=1 Tax=Daphnia pulicaria TaxID=35523 RepID=UPI001EEB080D|nr:aminopeptidase N-like [Daphnia pulicaria]XP_046631006.1 aminopeptidase N-like [Daphnia pulicaria]